MKDYTIAETAETLELHPGTVRRQIANGRLEAQKRGRDLFVSESAINRYRRDHLGQVGRYARPAPKPRPKRSRRAVPA